MEKIKCHYPGCKKEGVYTFPLELINEKGASAELPFCKYHHLIIMGGHFQAKIIRTPAIAPTNKEPKGTPEKVEFELIGPLKEVEITEQVMGARELIKLESDDKK